MDEWLIAEAWLVGKGRGEEKKVENGEEKGEEEEKERRRKRRKIGDGGCGLFVKAEPGKIVAAGLEGGVTVMGSDPRLLA